MPVHIESMSAEVTAQDDSPPLSERQIEAIVARVLERLRASMREDAQRLLATKIRTQAAPGLSFEE